MTHVQTNGHSVHAEHAPRPPPTRLEALHRAGLVARARGWRRSSGRSAPASSACSRSFAGWGPVWEWNVIVVVAFLTMLPIGFLAGIGAFDYWVYYALGGPTRAEDHSGHGATSWKDYFRVNTDHKVIGVQYLATVFFFFVIGGFAGDARARGAREAGHADHRQPGLQRLLHDARDADDLPLHHPGVRGPCELRRAADARRARHGVPAAERAVVLAAADRRHHADGLVPRARRPAGGRLDGLRVALDAPTHGDASSSTWRCSGRARARS